MIKPGELNRYNPEQYNNFTFDNDSVRKQFIAKVFSIVGVILALAITAVVVFALTIFAMQTKIDFTTCGGMLLMFIVILIIMGVVLMYFPDRVTKMAYVCFGVFCFGLYLVYDVQLMVGGSHAYAISPEEYVFAALSIYIDIINIFMYILALFGMSNDK
ncbi:protein lifeguard 1-like isoform X2 [Teleopsis dalmanni]|uniref:protein lifeguard 1-like isoform X2 n=1 Tax=Teleopsis dalmanni TaxID=139649 RepID=UPI0018CDE9A9|nr:protein lifeguard 1-like isoform X2 [Teleopsis dalmanni]